MRYTGDHKAKTHSRIVQAAGRLFRQQGYKGAGVDAVMKAAGLTPGGFYAHFDSKEALLAEALAACLSQTRERILAERSSGWEWVRKAATYYLSLAHRDEVAEGCPLPPLLSELPRAGEATRALFQDFLLGLEKLMAEKMPADSGLAAGDRALATVALFVGGLSLARAVPDPTLAERILSACRQLAAPPSASTPPSLPPGADPGAPATPE
jgi:TetR/AcrR family transcriptional repressor of nem operon